MTREEWWVRRDELTAEIEAAHEEAQKAQRVATDAEMRLVHAKNARYEHDLLIDQL